MRKIGLAILILVSSLLSTAYADPTDVTAASCEYWSSLGKQYMAQSRAWEAVHNFWYGKDQTEKALNLPPSMASSQSKTSGDMTMQFFNAALDLQVKVVFCNTCVRQCNGDAACAGHCLDSTLLRAKALH